MTFSALSQETPGADCRPGAPGGRSSGRPGPGADLQLSPETAACLAAQCAKGPGGARDIRRAIRADIEAPVADRLLRAEDRLCLCTAVEDARVVVKET